MSYLIKPGKLRRDGDKLKALGSLGTRHALMDIVYYLNIDLEFIAIYLK
jgi:hypothetical protein